MPSSYMWIDAAGVAYRLDDLAADGALTTRGPKSVGGMPAVRRARDVVAGVPGARTRHVEHDARRFELPVLFGAADLDALLELWTFRLDPKRGAGRLRATRTDGTVREVTCRYVDGLEVDESDTARFVTKQAAVCVFEADDPYWYDLADRSNAWKTAGTAPKWFDVGTAKRILPVQLAPSSVFGTTTLTLDDTDVAVWPRWVVDGPATQVTLTHSGKGLSVVWAGTLNAGQVLTIDTRPGVGTVLKDGVNAFAQLTAWDFFALEPGANALTIAVAGATSASRLSVLWRPGHRTP